MKILKTQSPLFYLPVELNDKDFLVIDSIRTCVEIIEFNYNSLQKKLLNVSNGIQIHRIELYHHAWNIIDYSERIKGLALKLESDIVKEFVRSHLTFIKGFRHTIQHLDGKHEMILGKKIPLFGCLNWIHQSLETRTFYPYSLFSGIAKINFKTNYRIPNLVNNKNEICNICLTTLKNKKKENIYIDNLIEILKRLMKILEDLVLTLCIENKVELKDWGKRLNPIIQLHQKG